MNRDNQRANALNIVNEISDEVFRQLRLDGRKMRFRALGKDNDSGADLDDDLFDDFDRLTDVTPERQTDQFLETVLGKKGLAHRLLRLASNARVAEQENGLNILYLALGFLTWREDRNPEVDRHAPLILLPVELVRNERTSTFDIKGRDEDISTNLPLAARLSQDFGLRLPEIPEDDEWLPSDYFASVAGTIEAHEDWSIDRNGIQLGFFSFAKLLMHRDLDPELWPDDALTGTDLMAGLLGDGFEEPDPLFGPDDMLDALLDPADMVQVVDADASQTKVIEEVRTGRNLVVQGPPGTGKSQTITNLIASAVHDGKTVLFVAEKMAALSVVHQRLTKAGLGAISLEIHSRRANKRAFVEELGRTLRASLKRPAASSSAGPLRQARNRLNDVARALHDPISPGMDSAFNVMTRMAKFLGSGAPTPRVPLADLETLSREQRKSALKALVRFRQALTRAGEPKSHPYTGVMALDLQPTDLARLEAEIEVALDSFPPLFAVATELADGIGRETIETLDDATELAAAIRSLAAPPKGITGVIDQVFDHLDDRRLDEGLAAGAAWVDTREALSDTVSDAAWTIETAAMRRAIVRGEGSFFARLKGAYRRASGELASVLKGPLPKSAAERRGLVDRIATVQSNRRALAADEAFLSAALGTFWRAERTDFAQLAEQVAWVNNAQSLLRLGSPDAWRAALDAIPEPIRSSDHLIAQRDKVRAAITTVWSRLDIDETATGDNLPRALDQTRLRVLEARLRAMHGQSARYDEWADMVRAAQAATELGAGSVVDMVLDGELSAGDAEVEFDFACAEAGWKHALKVRPELQDLGRLDRHESVELFRKLDITRFEETRDEILARHFEQVPKGTAGEMGFIRGEINRKRGHKPIRVVMRKAGAMVQRIKPVFLMSPLSVAQFLPPGSVKFDLLIIDEASQVRPEDALGVIARTRQIVVVGDEKQLPPTSFFDRITGDNDDDEDEALSATAADMESILALCDSKGISRRMLEWHYRSRDPSLIRVSNAEFYGDSMVLPPSPLEHDESYGLKFNKVRGVYSSRRAGEGRAGTNKIEAQEVIRAVAAHARDRPTLSLGIVTFSKAQADMMTDVLEHARRSDPVLDAFLREGQNEDVFVKNIENVQGDERDVILISVGYGPQEPGGRLASMNFGPVNGEGGERRLNVLFSRARVRCEIFASFEPGDIDLDRTTRSGPRVLKRFLDYAKSGVLEQAIPTGREADSHFEEDVASEITRLGYDVDPQVGSAGFRVDLGVRNPDRPGQYLLAVECDGATYHSALWARERDRLRQDVLEGLGWNFHRIWSTDWFHRREREIARLGAAIDTAKERMTNGVEIQGSNRDRPVQSDASARTPEVIDIPSALRIEVPPYVRASLRADTSVEPHLVKTPVLARLARKIVEIEGPIHADEVSRRIASTFGKQRSGSRIKDAALKALHHARSAGEGDVVCDGDFWCTSDQATDVPVRDRSGETGSLLKAANLPPIEIRAAADLIRKESGAIEHPDLVRAVGQLFGFQRVGPELQERISSEIER